MKIVVAGGTGFLGRPLTAALAADHHQVVVLSRGQGAAPMSPGVTLTAWIPNGELGPWAQEVDGADVVINLVGESIAGHRWSDQQKQRIRDSRVMATRGLVSAILRAAAPPAVLISGSAVGYYGPCGDEILTEDAPAGTDFLARVCEEWEREACRARGPRTRVVLVRTGIVLARDGGALPQMLPPFKLGVGGPLGSGRQYWPWIHRDDWIALVRWAVHTTSSDGAVNATAPHPATNAEFSRALGRALHRPAFMPTPGFALRLILGEMAGALLLSGQRAVPSKAEALGFSFRYPRLEDALAEIFAS